MPVRTQKATGSEKIEKNFTTKKGILTGEIPHRLSTIMYTFLQNSA